MNSLVGLTSRDLMYTSRYFKSNFKLIKSVPGKCKRIS